MNIAQEEAKKKWCPMYQVGSNGNNRDDGDNTFCIASECMMWQWDEGMRELQVNAKRQGTTELVKDTWAGYCGLAGKEAL